MSVSSNDAKGMRKGHGVQDSEVSTVEYVKNKIAQVLHDDGPGKGQGQEQGQGQQQMNRGQQQHLQVSLGTTALFDTVCSISKIVSMIRKYHNHKLQTNLWHHEEEPHNNHKTPGRQTKQSNQLSLPHQDDCKTKLEWTQRNTQQNRTIIESHTLWE